MDLKKTAIDFAEFNTIREADPTSKIRKDRVIKPNRELKSMLWQYELQQPDFIVFETSKWFYSFWDKPDESCPALEVLKPVIKQLNIPFIWISNDCTRYYRRLEYIDRFIVKECIKNIADAIDNVIFIDFDKWVTPEAHNHCPYMGRDEWHLGTDILRTYINKTLQGINEFIKWWLLFNC